MQLQCFIDGELVAEKRLNKEIPRTPRDWSWFGMAVVLGFVIGLFVASIIFTGVMNAEASNKIDAPEWTIAFKSEPVKTISCWCGDQTVDLNIDDEWVKAHSPDEIAMVFSWLSFIVSANASINASIGADYSGICCGEDCMGPCTSPAYQFFVKTLGEVRELVKKNGTDHLVGMYQINYNVTSKAVNVIELKLIPDFEIKEKD